MRSWKPEPKPWCARFISKDTLIHEESKEKDYIISFIVKFGDQHFEEIEFNMDSNFENIINVRSCHTDQMIPKIFEKPLAWHIAIFDCWKNTNSKAANVSLYSFRGSECTASMESEIALNAIFREPDSSSNSICSIV
jgi:hypothetical protein